MRVSPILLQVLLAVGFVATAQPSAAQATRRVSLNYTRGEGAQSCIDPVELARRVEVFTGPVLVRGPDADSAVEAHVEQRPGGGFRAFIRLASAGQSAHGERVLEDESTDCRNFAVALAFVIATTVDPDLAVERVGALFRPNEIPAGEKLLSELELAKPVQMPTPREPPVQAPVASLRTVVTRREPLRGAVGVGITSSSELPRSSLGPALALRARLRSWLDLGAGARALVALHQASVATARSADTQLFALALLVCPRVSVVSQQLVLAVCAGPEGSLLRSRGHGYATNLAGSIASWAVQLRPELSWSFARSLELNLSAFGRFTGRRPKLAADVAGTRDIFFESSPAAFGGELSLRRAF